MQVSTYVFENKHELAMFFIERANAAAQQAGRATTKRDQATWRSAAATWEQAANIIRNTHWGPEVRADMAGAKAEACDIVLARKGEAA